MTSLKDPVLRTEAQLGFEVLNDAFDRIAGHLATTPFSRETWLFAMTCEDRKVVHRKCVRCSSSAGELEQFANWRWCRDDVRCEQPWHWYRVVALHQMAKQWQKEEQAAHNPEPKTQGMPLVDKHATHRRIRPLSAGIYTNEKAVGMPSHDPLGVADEEIEETGLNLDKSAPDA